jgi:hypothetical protein
VRGFFRLRNINIVGSNCYMFWSYDHLQLDIYLHRTYSADNRSVVFRILVGIVDNYSDWFIVSWLLNDMVTIV